MQIFKTGVEGIAILHQELAAPHHAETRSDLVAELGLDLVQVQGQLAIALDFLTDEIGDHLFMRRSDNKLALMAILEAQQLRTILLAATRFLPQFKGLHCRHQHFEGTGAIHFIAHDRFHLAQGAKPQRRPGIYPGGQPTD